MTQNYIEFVIPQLNLWLAEGHKTALLTLVNIDGSAPYPIGSQMLVREDGASYGMITGGCIEAALIEEALRALLANKSHQQRYGKGSPYVDIQLPCGSGLDIVFEPNPDSVQCAQIEQAYKARQRSQLVVAASTPYTRHYLPRRRIALAGEGSIYSVFVPLAEAAGFEVMTVSHNQRDIAFDQWTAAVCLFHDHDKEIGFLSQACQSDSFYVGALGSHRAHSIRLAALSEAGLSEASSDKINSPVGLDIGSETPHEIAVSILAQIISHARQSVPAQC